jgi:hypothetical protein
MLQRWLRRVWVVAWAALWVCAAPAQQAAPAAEDFEEDQPPVFQLNVSPRLLMQGLDLLVDKRLVKDYGLDEFQAEEMKQLLHREVPKFLEKHQAELETLATEWLEAASGPEPPTAEYAAQWAARFRPIVEESEQLIGRVGDGMREFLNDEQQVFLDSYMVGANMATTRIKGKLQDFEQGRFTPSDWVGNKNARQRDSADVRKLETQMARARQQALDYANGGETPPPAAGAAPVRDGKAAAPGDYQHAAGREAAPRPAGGAADKTAPAQPSEAAAASAKDKGDAKGDAKAAAPKHEWEIYVEEFIKKYSLNEEQQQKARLFLGQAMEQRQKHLTRNGQRMESITKMFETAKTDQQRQTAESAYKELNLPLDRTFERLKSKLEQLPTRQQRAAAPATPAAAPTKK